MSTDVLNEFKSDTSKLEYLCPFCKDWILKKDFVSHGHSHRNDPMCEKYPETPQEMWDRFYYIGLWDER